MSQDPVFEHEVERHYRHNFIFNLLDGANFWLGYSFIAPGVILPLYVSHFTDSKLMIGLVATISATGYFLPQLFTANWVERMPRKRDVVVKLGFIAERVPLFLFPLAALLATRSSALALVLFFILFAWHSFGAGTLAVAWQDMIGKVIPLDRRGRFMGLTNFSGTAAGVIGAGLAAWLLDKYPFPSGYVYSFAIAGVFVFLSWVCLAQTREPPLATNRPKVSQAEYLKTIPDIIRNDQNFARFIAAMVVSNLAGMGWGFLAVYALQRWHLPDGQVGGFTAWMLIGQALSNLVMGFLGDRKGYKLVLELSTLMAVASLALTFLAADPFWIYIVFILRGASLAGFMVAMLMPLEFSSRALRPTYIGLNNTVAGVISLVAPLLGSAIASITSYPILFGISAVLGLVSFGILHWLVREPRLASLPFAAGDVENV